MNIKLISLVIVALLLGSGGTYYATKRTANVPVSPVVSDQNDGKQNQNDTNLTATSDETPAAATPSDTAMTVPASSHVEVTAGSGTHVYTHDELLSLADNKYSDGSVPLGDDKYTTSGAKKGYVYLCNVHKDNPGSMVNGPWMHGSTWNYLEKVSVSGSVSWPQAVFSNIISAGMRILSGNGLPTNHTTGTFPVSQSDKAATYDRNPNTITEQRLKESLPANPTYNETPYCMGGEVGIMLTGIPLFNAFDAGLRDAPAHELQDSCDGHPQGTGEYHYHSLSSCFKDTSVTTVLGYAYDGFPITGGKVADNKYLTTEDLDVCHGLTSEVIVDGKKVSIYHYVMTRDFPYSAGCFRGKPVTTGPSAGGAPKANSGQTGGGTAPQGSTSGPPQEAIAACSGKTDGEMCSFTGGRGETITGSCKTPPNSSLACVPAR